MVVVSETYLPRLAALINTGGKQTVSASIFWALKYQCIARIIARNKQLFGRRQQTKIDPTTKTKAIISVPVAIECDTVNCVCALPWAGGGGGGNWAYREKRYLSGSSPRRGVSRNLKFD